MERKWNFQRILLPFPAVWYTYLAEDSQKGFSELSFHQTKWRNRILNQRFILVGKSAVPSHMYALIKRVVMHTTGILQYRVVQPFFAQLCTSLYLLLSRAGRRPDKVCCSHHCWLIGWSSRSPQNSPKEIDKRYPKNKHIKFNIFYLLCWYHSLSSKCNASSSTMCPIFSPWKYYSVICWILAIAFALCWDSVNISRYQTSFTPFYFHTSLDWVGYQMILIFCSMSVLGYQCSSTSSNSYSISALGWYHCSFSFYPKSASFGYQYYSPANPASGFYNRLAVHHSWYSWQNGRQLVYSNMLAL